MKKKLSAILAAALIITGLTGCQGGAAGESSAISTASVNLEPTDEFIIYRPPYTPDWLSEAIALFRQVYPDVKVIIEDFSTTGTYKERCERYQDRINNELTAGVGPDIIFPNYLDTDIYKAMQGGIYLNLNPFFEQDKYFNEDSFLSGVFDAGRYQGKQYIVPINVRYPMFIARTPILEQLCIDQVASKDTASFLRQIGEKSPQAQAELNFDRMMDHSMYFPYFLTWANLKLVDYENNQVCPEPGKVHDFMEAYKTYYQWDISDKGLTISGAIAYGQYKDEVPNLPVDFCYDAMFDNFHCFQFMSASCLDADGSYNNFFLRDMDGNVNTLYGEQVAVPVTSKNQLNAYRFIQILLSDAIQDEPMIDISGLYDRWFSPVNRDVMETQIREEMAKSQVDISINGKKMGFVKAVPATDWLEHIEKLNSVDSSVMFNDTVMQMVWESMEPFFTDEKSYEACFDEMQTKLKLYMDE